MIVQLGFWAKSTPGVSERKLQTQSLQQIAILHDTLLLTDLDTLFA